MEMEHPLPLAPDRAPDGEMALTLPGSEEPALREALPKRTRRQREARILLPRRPLHHLEGGLRLEEQVLAVQPADLGPQRAPFALGTLSPSPVAGKARCGVPGCMRHVAGAG